MVCMKGVTTARMMRIQPRRGVMENNVIPSAMLDVNCWKKLSCRVSSSIGLTESVFCAWTSDM